MFTRIGFHTAATRVSRSWHYRAASCDCKMMQGDCPRHTLHAVVYRTLRSRACVCSCLSSPVSTYVAVPCRHPIPQSLTSRPGSRRAGSARCCLFEFVVFPDPCDRAILQAEQSDTGGGRTCGVRAQRRTGPRRSEPSAPRAVDRPRGEPLTIPPAPRKNPCVYPRARALRAPRYTDAEKSKRPHRTHRMFGSPW